MSIDMLIKFLGWCTIINLGLLLWWVFFISCVHDWTYRMHTKWLYVNLERFDAIHYAGIAYYKITIIIFNVVPYLSLRIIT